MRVKFSLELIVDRNPEEIGSLLLLHGIDPASPYRARVTFSGITIEQEREEGRPAV